MKVYTPEENIFHSIVVDLTHRCNMECANCYIPNREIDDMDVEKLYDLISRLPKRAEIRLMGGEPTVRKDLPEIIHNIRKLGHRPTILTNGLKLGNVAYVQRLINAGLRSLNISMNGADDDDVYEVMDGIRCADRKMAAFKNVMDSKVLLNINCIIQKGVNEHVPGRLLELVGDKPVVLRFRNVGQIGRYSLEKDENYTFDELITMIAKLTGVTEDFIHQHHTVEGFNEEHNVLFPIGPKQYVKITDWAPYSEDIPDPGSKRRGRVTEGFMLAPFFEHVKENEFGY